MYWAIFGLFHGIFRAAFAETNRLYKVEPWRLSFWQAGAAFIILTPFIPLMHWPVDTDFYLAAVLVALILSVGVVIQMTLSGEKKGRIYGIAIPVEALAAALIWTAVQEDMVSYYAQSPFMTAGVVCAFALVIASLYFVRTVDLSWHSFAIVAPVGISYAVAAVVTKLVMPEEHLIQAALAFVLINYGVMTAVMAIVLLLKRKADSALYEKQMIKAGGLTGFFAALAYLTFVASVVFAPNPGYTGLLAALVPVWIMWYHELRFETDRANPLAVCMVAAGAILLIVSTAL